VERPRLLADLRPAPPAAAASSLPASVTPWDAEYAGGCDALVTEANVAAPETADAGNHSNQVTTLPRLFLR
jgi:hypothetical protein